MDFSLFHFAQPAWLWGVIAVPLVLLLRASQRTSAAPRELDAFADRSLLPHLIRNSPAAQKRLWPALMLWSFAWTLGLLALAGPRWDYTDVQAFRSERDLVIVLDLSKTMDAQDVKPSRIVRARQEIEDLLNLNKDISVGLVAYAAVPHMVTPVTDDMRTIRDLLPALETSLVTIDGDRLKPALDMAARMLDAEKGGDKSILLVSDGGFEENDFSALARAAHDIPIYTLGIGTAEGSPVANGGGWIKDADGKLLISKLEANRLRDLSAASGGTYVAANYTNSDIRALLSRMDAFSAGETSGKTTRYWEERFYIPAFVLALLLLPLFRKSYIFPIVLLALLLLPAHKAEAADWTDLFRNKAQQGQEDFNRGDYKGAAGKFDAPYQHGVAEYKAGAFDRAEKSFKAAGASPYAEYNLGNAELMQNRPEDAISSYESALKKNPDDKSARHNLEIAKKMLQKKQEEQKQQQGGKKSEDQKKQSGAQKNQQKNNESGDQAQSQKNEQKGQQGQQPQAGKENETPKEQFGAQNSQAQKNAAGNQKEKQHAGTPQPQEQSQNQNEKNNVPPQARNGEQKESREKNKENGTPLTAQTQPRTQQDINADQWLNRVESDPGSFLKNQFMLEDRESETQKENQP